MVVWVSMGSFRGGQAGHAASAARRETAWVSAPADSRAAVASAISRPVMPLPRRTEIEAWTSEPLVGGRQVVGDVEPDGTVRGEREPLRLGLVDLDVEADAAAGQAAGDAGAGAGDQARRVEVVDVERERRPAGHRVGVGEHVEDRSGPASTVVVAVQVFMLLNRPTTPRAVSSAWQTILRPPLDDLASSSRMTRDRQAGRRLHPARALGLAPCSRSAR